jgi:hypothetical protein
MKIARAVLPGILLCLAARAASAAPATGMTINNPLVARLIGSGPTLYITTMDIQNNWTVATQVDWYLRGTDLATSVAVAANGSISSTGTLVAQGAGGTMRARSNAHFEDFVDSAVKAGFLPASIETDGFIGSVFLIFNGFTRPGQGSSAARFYSSFGGGTIGQALKGHEITVAEPQKIVGFARDTRGEAGAQLYSNIFVNNVGIAPGGGAGGAVTVHIEAFANSTGTSVGTPIDTVLAPGQTVSVSSVLTSLKVPAGEDTVLVYVTVTSGTSAIAGVFATVDNVTRDGSTADMSAVD